MLIRLFHRNLPGARASIAVLLTGCLVLGSAPAKASLFPASRRLPATAELEYQTIPPFALWGRWLVQPPKSMHWLWVSAAVLAVAPTAYHAVASLTLNQVLVGAFAAASLLVPLSAAWTIPHKLPDDYTWSRILWKGAYGERRFSKRYGLPLLDESLTQPTPVSSQVPPAYPHLQTPEEEINHLLDHLLSHDSEPRRSALERMKAGLPKELAPDDQSELIGHLRWTFMDLEIRDPRRQSEWNQALKIIGKRLETLRRRPGDGAWVYGQVMRKLEEIAAALPLFDEIPATEETPGRFDNLRSFILDVPHGLAHSLDILEDLMVVDDQSFATEEERGYAKEVHIGAAFFHDLTALRDRYRHHETARDLVVGVLDPLRNPDGTERYSRRLINDIALTCQNHRGQKYQAPQDEIQEIFMEVDEYNLIKNLQRIMDQPANGFFQPDFLDVYRDYSFQERRRHDTGPPFKHETPQADFTQYLLMTQIIRTNTDIYKNPVIRRWIAESYPVIKDRVLRIAQTKIFEEVMGKEVLGIDTQKLLEVKKRIHRFKGLVRELEALYRQDSIAKARIQKEAGTVAVLTQRVRTLESQMESELQEPMPEGPLQDAFYLLRLLNSHQQKTKQVRKSWKKTLGPDFPKSSLAESESAQSLFPNFSFRVGRALADLYLENPFVSLPELLTTLELRGVPIMESDLKNLSRSLLYLRHPAAVTLRQDPAFQAIRLDYVYAGLAYGLSQIAAYRVQRLYEIVASNASELSQMRDKDQKLGITLAFTFLHRVGRGQPMMEVLRSQRHEMDSLRYGPTRPETWDAEDFPTIESLLSWIQRAIKGEAHTHLGGLPWVQHSAAIFENNPKLIAGFRAMVGDDREIDPRNPEELRKLLYEQRSIDSDRSFERVFLAAHAYLNPDRGRYHFELLRQAVINAAAEGTQFAGIISSFGQETRSAAGFRRVVEASLEGILAGEAEAARTLHVPVRGGLLLALRKTTPPEKALSLTRQWLDLRQRFIISDPEFARRMFGVDSIGYENGFDISTHREAFDLARAHGQWVQAHVGERWPEAPMEDTLLTLKRFIEGGFHSVVNCIALFVDPTTLTDKLFTPERKAALAALQTRIVESAIGRRVWLQFSPASNEINSKDSRRALEWQFRRLDPWILKGLKLLPSADDPGPFETNLPLEFLQLYMGTSAYGPIGFAALKALLHNSQQFCELSLARLEAPLRGAS